jgi:hypothetical protein
VRAFAKGLGLLAGAGPLMRCGAALQRGGARPTPACAARFLPLLMCAVAQRQPAPTRFPG